MTAPASIRRRGAWALAAHQVRYQIKVFLRSPVAVFFTVMLPLFMLVLFNAIFGDERVETPQGSWPLRQFYVGGIAAFSAVSATFTNLANVLPVRRDDGVLKRWRSTPLPPWACITGMVGSAIVVAAVGTLLMVTVGIVGYGVEIGWGKLPFALVTFVVGVGTFAALGVAVACLIPSAEAAPAVANAIILPMAFVSDVFIQTDESPRWLQVAGDVLPLRPFAQTFQDLFNPFVDAPNVVWDRLLRIAVWGVVGALVAVRTFRWEPATGASGSDTRRRSRRRRGASVPAGAS